MRRLPFHADIDPITLQLDRAASILRNYHDDPVLRDHHDGDHALTLTDDECSYLSTLLTRACNEIVAVRR